MTNPGWTNEPDSAPAEETSDERIDSGKRIVALLIDIFAAYILAIAIRMLLGIIPLLGNFVPHELIMIIFWLGRDFLFGGRGLGKNLMGLQVVDVRSGLPATLKQSIQRNGVIVGPLFIYFVVTSLMHVMPIPMVNEVLTNLMTFLGTIYYLIVIPYESYRTYTRADGRRFGDEFAGTVVIEAPMDFSEILPR